MKQKSEKRFPKFANFGEYLFWSYANLQMLCAALNMGKAKYDKSCYMIRAKTFSARPQDACKARTGNKR